MKSTDGYENTILHIEYKNKDLNIIKYLISLDISDNSLMLELGRIFLFSENISINIDAIKYLDSIDKIDISAVDADGNNALYYSCYEDNIDMIQYIISFNKIDISAVNNIDHIFFTIFVIVLIIMIIFLKPSNISIHLIKLILQKLIKKEIRYFIIHVILILLNI